MFAPLWLSHCDFFFVFECGVSDFFGGFQHPTVNGCPTASCNFGALVIRVSEVAHLCPTLFDPMDCILPGFSIHGIFQARVLEWVAISFCRGFSQPRDWTRVSRIVGRRFTIWATREVLVRGEEHISSYSTSLKSHTFRPIVWMTIIPKMFSHFCEGSEPHVRLPGLGVQQMVLEFSGNPTLKASGILLQKLHRTGRSRDSTLGGHKQNLLHTKTQGKGAVTPQETEAQLPASISGSPVEV